LPGWGGVAVWFIRVKTQSHYGPFGQTWQTFVFTYGLTLAMTSQGGFHPMGPGRVRAPTRIPRARSPRPRGPRPQRRPRPPTPSTRVHPWATVPPFPPGGACAQRWGLFVLCVDVTLFFSHIIAIYGIFLHNFFSRLDRIIRTTPRLLPFAQDPSTVTPRMGRIFWNMHFMLPPSLIGAIPRCRCPPE